jgi:threonine dehydrogenase-like Zn-dependent dehydrogenase
VKAVWLDKQLSLEPSCPDPEPAEGEALIRVILAGICRTDLELARGYMDFHGIPGHEFVGEVTWSPEPRWVGKRVVGEINCGCGDCSACREGLERHCPDRTVLGIQNRNGCFAESVTLPLQNLHEVPPNVSDEAAVLAEPLAAAFEILEQVSVGPNQKIALVGDGKLGLLVAQVLYRTGADLVVFGHHPERAAFLKDKGADVRHKDQWTDGDIGRFDMVVEASGSVAGFEFSQRLVRPRGTLVLKSTIASREPMNLSFLVIQEITLVGSRCGPFEPALKMLASQEVRTGELVSRTFPIAESLQAFAWAEKPGAGKVLIRP